MKSTEEGSEIKRKLLPKPSVDTGSGLERIAAALQGKYYNYDTDVFAPIMKSIGQSTGKDYYSTKSRGRKILFPGHCRSRAILHNAHH